MNEKENTPMHSSSYPEPVNKLLSCGRPESPHRWRWYPDLGLTEADIPHLLRMLTDEALYWADPDSAELWGPLHAWRSLAQLRAVDAIPALIDCLFRIDAYDNDWILEEFPAVFACIGPAAIPFLSDYVDEDPNGLFARACAIYSLERIGNETPACRDRCVEALERTLRRYTEHDPALNGFLIHHLAELGATEAMETIRRAYSEDRVDKRLCGELADLERELAPE